MSFTHEQAEAIHARAATFHHAAVVASDHDCPVCGNSIEVLGYDCIVCETVYNLPDHLLNADTSTKLAAAIMRSVAMARRHSDKKVAA